MIRYSNRGEWAARKKCGTLDVLAGIYLITFGSKVITVSLAMILLLLLLFAWHGILFHLKLGTISTAIRFGRFNRYSGFVYETSVHEELFEKFQPTTISTRSPNLFITFSAHSHTKLNYASKDKALAMCCVRHLFHLFPPHPTICNILLTKMDQSVR